MEDERTQGQVSFQSFSALSTSSCSASLLSKKNLKKAFSFLQSNKESYNWTISQFQFKFLTDCPLNIYDLSSILASPHSPNQCCSPTHKLAQLFQYCSLHLSRQLDRKHIALEHWNEFLYLSSKQIHSPRNPSFLATLHIRSLPFITACKCCVV